MDLVQEASMLYPSIAGALVLGFFIIKAYFVSKEQFNDFSDRLNGRIDKLKDDRVEQVHKLDKDVEVIKYKLKEHNNEV